MNPEERLHNRLREALHDRADQIEVDLPRVHDLTEAKLAAPRHRRTWPLLAAAAAVAVVAAGATVLGRSGSEAPTHPPIAGGPHWPHAAPQRPHGPQAGGVATRFSCSHRSTVRFDPVAKDLSFVPSLEHSPRWFAAQMQAPRYAFEVNGDTATLRLGNADGSLASVSTFTRASGQWDPVRATKCVNGPFRAEDPHRLGAATSNPPVMDPRVREAARGCSAPTLVDGYGYYDVAGLLRHEWTYAAACPAGKVRLAMVTTQDGGAAVTTSSLPALKPVDVSRLPFAADLGPGRRVGLWVLYDAHHSVAGLSAELSNGQSLPAETVDLRKHSGTLFLVLASRDQVEQLVVHPVQGAATTYSQTNPPGYRR